MMAKYRMTVADTVCARNGRLHMSRLIPWKSEDSVPAVWAEKTECLTVMQDATPFNGQD